MSYSENGRRSIGLNRRLRSAASYMVWSIALVAALGAGPPVLAGVPTDAPLDLVESGGESLHGDVAIALTATGLGPIDERAPDDVTNWRMAQFQLKSAEGEVKELPKRLTFSYGFGADVGIALRTDQDLDRAVNDDAYIVTPSLGGSVTYRPNDWLHLQLEGTLDQEWRRGPEVVVLPDGKLQLDEKRPTSLIIDQAFARIRGFAGPLEITLGRQTFSNLRNWAFDTTLDAAAVSARTRTYLVEANVGRNALVDLDLLTRETKGRITTYRLYAEYRGFESIQFAGYGIFRDHLDRQEAEPVHLGLSSLGAPTENFNYWAEFSYLVGQDELSRKFSAYAFDVGGTYQLRSLPLNPNVTLGFASATGDGNPNDNRNNEYRQTGVHGNGTRFTGITDFQIYGNALDPELSNLEVFTVGVGLRPVPIVSVDFIYHYYRLDKISTKLRDSAVTAQMNQDPSRQSKNVGSALDIVFGMRNLFGVPRLGIDLKTGWFFPGDSFRIDRGGGIFGDADAGFSFEAKFLY